VRRLDRGGVIVNVKEWSGDLVSEDEEDVGLAGVRQGRRGRGDGGGC